MLWTRLVITKLLPLGFCEDDKVQHFAKCSGPPIGKHLPTRKRLHHLFFEVKTLRKRASGPI
ncbi:hypothetical protein Plhal710r2_c007g0034071 [Plasmopara halstedii]